VKELWTPPDYSESIQVNEPTLILTDTHLPYADYEWIGRTLRVAKRLKVKDVVLGGDVVDGNAYSRWGNNGKEGLEHERRAWYDELHPQLSKSGIKHNYWILGNHEDRFARAVDYRTDTGDLIRAMFEMKNTTISDYHWCYVYDVYVCHPKGAGEKEHLKIAEQVNTHVVCGHSHHWYMSQTNSGKHMAFQIGWCGDENKLRYYMTDAPHGSKRYVQGAMIVLQKRGKTVFLPMVAGGIEPEVYLD